MLNIPQKKGKPPDDADQEYSILGKCLESDPWETEPEYKEQVAVVHLAPSCRAARLCAGSQAPILLWFRHVAKHVG